MKCLKNAAKHDPEDAKNSIHSNKKAVVELVEDMIALEKFVTVEECEDWLIVISGSIVEKY